MLFWVRTKTRPLSARDPHQLQRLLERQGHRLVADDVDARLEERLGHLEMEMVGRDDRDGIDAVVALRLAGRHVPPRAVDALALEAEVEAGGFRVLGIGRQGAGHDLPFVVEPSRHPVDRADEGAAPTAHHAQAELLRRLLGAEGSDRHGA